jgi:tol-pal system protein YbgF
MKSLYTIAMMLVFVSTSYPADKKTLLDVSRDVAEVQDQVRQLQRSMDDKLLVIQTQLQQAGENAKSADKGVAVLENSLRNAINDQMSKVTAPIVNLSTKVDQMSTDFAALSNAVADLTQRMAKLQTQVGDLANTIKVMQDRPAPPPGVGVPGSTTTPGGPAAGSSTPPANMPPAKDLYDAAQRDRSGGNFDLAMQGFQQYLQWYPNTPLAPNAQFFVGQIYYDKGDYASAITAFDAVLERFPENNKTPDATYMKGMALWKSGQATAAGRTFMDVIQKYPKSEVAPKAREARKMLGLSVPSASTGSKSTKKRKR